MSSLINFDKYDYAPKAEEIKVFDNTLNTFIPFVNLFNGELVSIDNKLIYIYKFTKPKSFRQFHGKSIYLNLFDFLSRYIHPSQYFKIQDNNYYIAKGFIADNVTNKLLMVLTVQNNYIFHITKDNVDYNKFVLLIDNIFKNPEHKTLFSRVNKEYIQPLIDAGISVMYSDNIETWCHNEIDLKPKFRTLTEMNQYLNNFNKIAYGRELTDE